MLITSFFLLAAIQAVGDSDLIRLAPLILIFIEAGKCIQSGKFHSPAIGVSLPEFFVGAVLPMQSILVLLASSEIRPLTYALTMSLTVACIHIIVSARGLASVLDQFIVASTLAAIGAAIFDWTGFLEALSAVQTDFGLLRFMAFEGHPNLTGHNFGGAAVACFGRFLISTDTRQKTILLMCFGILSTLPFAASSRGGLAAMGSGVLVMSILYGQQISSRFVSNASRKYFILTILVLIISFIVACFTQFEYFAEMLDASSEYRGLGSGFTGRTDNWYDVFVMASESTRVMLLGNGLRSWDDNIMGFATDSSYVNMLWEIGLPLTVLLTLFVLYRAFWFLFNDRHGIGLIAFGILVFVLVEGLVARFFIGIGNPVSVLTLALLTGVRSRELLRSSSSR